MAHTISGTCASQFFDIAEVNCSQVQQGANQRARCPKARTLRDLGTQWRLEQAEFITRKSWSYIDWISCHVALHWGAELENLTGQVQDNERLSHLNHESEEHLLVLDQVTDIWNQQAEVCKKNLEAMEEHGTNISLMLLQIPKLKEQ
jgi:hypothetical protein